MDADKLQECLASATVTELFFLHERAFRLGIYTLLLLSGKNLMPLVSAEIIQVSGWRMVFWYVMSAPLSLNSEVLISRLLGSSLLLQLSVSLY
jgi:MFS family permease